MVSPSVMAMTFPVVDGRGMEASRQQGEQEDSEILHWVPIILCRIILTRGYLAHVDCIWTESMLCANGRNCSRAVIRGSSVTP